MKRRKRKYSPKDKPRLRSELISLRHYASQCDGSCLITQEHSQEVPCVSGEPLRFYWCRHSDEWILTNYKPTFTLTAEDDDCPY